MTVWLLRYGDSWDVYGVYQSKDAALRIKEDLEKNYFEFYDKMWVDPREVKE